MARLKSHPALVIIDMENGFCHPSGCFGMMGMPVSSQQSIVPAINRLRSVFHVHGLPVFFTATAFNEDYSDAGLDVNDFPALKDARGFIRGTWDAQIVDELKPNETTETLILKTANTAFWKTGFDELLRKRGINQIIATGVGTNVCVESTVRDARTHGFHTLTVSDATATVSEEEHQASMLNLRRFGGIITTEELEKELKEWKSSDVPPRN